MKLGILKDFGVGGLVRACNQLTAFGIIIVAGRILSQEEFGVYAIAAVFTTLVSTVLYSGIYEYIIKSEDTAAVADTCFWINFAIGSAGAVVMIIAAPIVANAVGAPDLLWIMMLLAPSSFIPALTSWQEALVLRSGRISTYYFVWFFAESFSAALTVALFYYGLRIEALVAYRYSLGMLTAIGYFTQFPKLPRLIFQRAEASRALKFASRLFGSRVIGIAGNYGADLILGVLAGPAQAGTYRLANRLVFGVAEMWFQPIKMIAWVRFSSATRDGRRIGADWVALMAILSLVAWPALAGVAVLATPIAETLLGPSWTAAGPVIAVLALVKSAELIEIFLDPLLILSARPHWLLRVRAISCGLAIAGFTAFADYGALPAAWVQVAIYLLLAMAALAFGISQTGIHTTEIVQVLWPGLVTSVVTATAAAIAIHYTAHAQWGAATGLAVCICAGALAWGAMAGFVFRSKALAAAAALRG